MSERDYSRLEQKLRPECWPNHPHVEALANTLLDLMDSSDALAKRIDQHDANIETAANDHAVLRERVATIEASFHALTSKPTWRDEIAAAISPAQADVGEASAESEWPRYVQINEYRIARFDDANSPSKNFDLTNKIGCTWNSQTPDEYIGRGQWKLISHAEARIAAARGEKPRLDDAFPIPAPVEQGPTEGMKAVAATCKGCGKPMLPENAWVEDGCPCNSPKGCNAPAQAGTGESSAESEWPRYVQINEYRIARFDGPLTESINLDNGIDRGSRGVFWREAGHYLNDGRWTMLPRAEAEARIAAARGEKPRLDDAFPIPAPVEQGPTEGMRRAAVEICGHANHPSVAAIRSLLSTHIGPELAAKDAEIERLKGVISSNQPNGKWLDQYGSCRVCGGEIPHGHSAECDHWKLEQQIADSKKFADDVAAAVNGWEYGTRNAYMRDLLIGQIADLRSQLSAATAANVERGKLIHDILEYVEPIYGHWGNGLVQRMKDVLAARDAAEGNG